MAFVAPPPVWGPIADHYGEQVAKLTNGEIKVQGVGGGQLGSLPQNYAGMKTGQIDMVLVDTGTLALARGGKDFNALFDWKQYSWVHFEAVFDNPLTMLSIWNTLKVGVITASIDVFRR